ncbi:Hypothetical Protein RRSL_01501 [Ralstonia solanacearum UW551]|uniref:Uncharacterized protein n=1 Tax=Ralstonia solanacearum (strain UW551) TaxID=342110 RepID=A0AB33V9E5_RALSU|nr:Hypothetical Protein RRSL_01501 [Ralstonia solanacearum UW551]
MDRLLRPDRAQPRLRPGLDGHAREEGGRRLLADRRQDVDHQLAHRRRLRGVGQAAGRERRRPDPRLHPGEGLEGPVRPGHPRQGRPAHIDHRRDRARRRVRARREPDARRARPQGPVHLPELRALRHRLGRARRGRVLLAHRAPVRTEPHAVRPPARRQPTDPEEARRHADRDHARPAGLPAPGPHEGRGHRGGGDHLDHEAQLVRQVARHRPHGARHAGRQRHLRRIRRDPPRGEPGGGQHVRGHARHPCADPGPRADGHPGVLLILKRPRIRGGSGHAGASPAASPPVLGIRVPPPIRVISVCK